jgi:hypothetical protein
VVDASLQLGMYKQLMLEYLVVVLTLYNTAIQALWLVEQLLMLLQTCGAVIAGVGAGELLLQIALQSQFANSPLTVHHYFQKATICHLASGSFLRFDDKNMFIYFLICKD